MIYSDMPSVALAEAVRRHAGRVFEHSRAVKITGRRLGRVQTAGGPQITADHIIAATNAPTHDKITVLNKQAPYRTYVIAATVPNGVIPKALYWDTPVPYHYIRLSTAPRQNGSPQDLLIVGGEDHRTAEKDARRSSNERASASPSPKARFNGPGR